jgi:hypothetical protein
VPQVNGEIVRVLLFSVAQLALIALAFAVGRVSGRFNADFDCDVAYLSGHVDGYNKAVFDSGEVFE